MIILLRTVNNMEKSFSSKLIRYFIWSENQQIWDEIFYGPVNVLKQNYKSIFEEKDRFGYLAVDMRPNGEFVFFTEDQDGNRMKTFALRFDDMAAALTFKNRLKVATLEQANDRTTARITYNRFLD